MFDKVFHDGGPFGIETSPLICTANMIANSVMKELIHLCFINHRILLTIEHISFS